MSKDPPSSPPSTLVMLKTSAVFKVIEVGPMALQALTICGKAVIPVDIQIVPKTEIVAVPLPVLRPK